MYIWPHVNGENVFIKNVEYQGMKICFSA